MIKYRNKIMIRILKFILLAVFFILATNFVLAANSQDSQKVIVYFFWGTGCSDCAHQEALLENLKQKYPQIEIESYESLNNRDNAIIFSRIARNFNISSPVVPTTFIDNKSWVGYNASFAQEIKNRIEYCLKNKCADPFTETASALSQDKAISPEEVKNVTVPFFGEIEPSKVSLPIFTVLIGGFDAFNPCAFFVLLILLSLLIRTGSRKRMLLVGGIFIFFSGFIYFLFMAAWLNLFLIIGHLQIVTAIAGTIAVIIALINIKDFFFFKKGVSLTISEQARPKLFERMRNTIERGSFLSIVLATIALGVMANIYELFCTPGFPMIYTRVLTMEQLPSLQHYMYLVLYNIVYVIPLISILLILTCTLGQKKLSQRQGRILKLVSGMMMLFLGAILVIKPALLGNVAIALTLFVAAILSSGIIIFIYRIFNKETA